MPYRLFALLVFFWLLGSGCTKQIRTNSSKKQVIQLGPTVFYSKGGKVVRVEHLSPNKLFDKATHAYQNGRFQEAYQYYGRLVHFHKRSAFYRPALYNYGLTLEKLKRFQAAAVVFRSIMKTTKDPETKKDAHFRLGAVLSSANMWEEAERTYRSLRRNKLLTLRDKLEVLTRLGVSLQEQKQIPTAMMLFRKVITMYRRHAKKEYLGSEYFTSMAHFQMGVIFDRRFRERKFRPKQSDMKKDLDAKASDLLTAQAHYVRTIRLRNSVWVVRALYRIGEMYAKMYDDMLHAPIPNDLTQEEIRLYKKMLKKKIRILLTKANYAFERNIQLAQVLGMNDDGWVAKTRKRMQELRERIVKEYFSEPSNTKKTPTRTRSQRVSSRSNKKPVSLQ